MTDQKAPFATVEEAIEEIRQGRMIVLVDDEDRENEGDLTMAAEKITPEAINFMSKYGRGLICLSLSEQRCDALDLKPISERNTSAFGTPFCEPIDARRGTTTGISAWDRATTLVDTRGAGAGSRAGAHGGAGRSRLDPAPRDGRSAARPRAAQGRAAGAERADLHPGRHRRRAACRGDQRASVGGDRRRRADVDEP